MCASGTESRRFGPARQERPAVSFLWLGRVHSVASIAHGLVIVIVLQFLKSYLPKSSCHWSRCDSCWHSYRLGALNLKSSGVGCVALAEVEVQFRRDNPRRELPCERQCFVVHIDVARTKPKTMDHEAKLSSTYLRTATLIGQPMGLSLFGLEAYSFVRHGGWFPRSLLTNNITTTSTAICCFLSVQPCEIQLYSCLWTRQRFCLPPAKPTVSALRARAPCRCESCIGGPFR